MSQNMNAFKRSATPGGVANEEQVDPRLHDADGKQLAAGMPAAHRALVDWDAIPAKPDADLSLESTERRRAARARRKR